MSRNASDPPDKVVWRSERIAPITGRDIDDDAEPERLPVFTGRKTVLSGITLLAVGGVLVWVVTSGASEPATTVARSTPAPAVTDGEPVESPPAESRPVALTVQDARRAHDRYARDLSLAQQEMDDRALGRLERGLALEMSKAAFETARTQGTKVAAGLWPKPDIWVPRDTAGTTDWFVAVAHEPEVARVSKLLTSTPDGWRLTAFTADTHVPAAPLPEIAIDADGYATSLPEDASGLLATPRQAVHAHLASLESATPDRLFADGPWTDQAVTFWRQEREQLEKAGWELSLFYRPVGPVRSLMTSDGGALVWYGARSTDLREARRAGATVTLNGSAGVRTGGTAFARSASATYGRMYVAYIPPASSGERVRVLGEWSEVLESHGT
ncbi:hypothetical protein [Planobispora rosea]|uniref:hypothetical protein n=1 Tax=Planobispora rosea TaxID=35762 RepID=UPI00114D2719|nr:hypothetical protein [Planobispora rosea]